jgi:hypothetical protein
MSLPYDVDADFKKVQMNVSSTSRVAVAEPQPDNAIDWEHVQKVVQFYNSAVETLPDSDLEITKSVTPLPAGASRRSARVRHKPENAKKQAVHSSPSGIDADEQEWTAITAWDDGYVQVKWHGSTSTDKQWCVINPYQLCLFYVFCCFNCFDVHI